MVCYSGDARAGDLSYVRSTDHGATWSAAIAVNEPGSAIAAVTIHGNQVAVGRNSRQDRLDRQLAFQSSSGMWKLSADGRYQLAGYALRMLHAARTV